MLNKGIKLLIKYVDSSKTESMFALMKVKEVVLEIK